MLTFLAILMVLSALPPGNDCKADPVGAFLNLFQKCEVLKNFMPMSTAKAEIWSPVLANDNTSYDISKTLLDLRESETGHETSLIRAIWSHDMTRFGITIDQDILRVFKWKDGGNEMDLVDFRTECGFATEDYVYAVLSTEDGVKKFARWKVDLSGELEILGNANPDGSWLFFQYASGPTYYLSGDKCLQIDDLKQLSEGYQNFRECNTSQGMFAFSDLYEWYSLSAFAWLTKECDGEIWSNYDNHASIKIRFLPDDSPAVPGNETVSTIRPHSSSTTTTEVTTARPPCPNLTTLYLIAFSGLAISLISISIANGMFWIHMRRKLREARLQAAHFESLHDSNSNASTRKGTTYTTTTMADSSSITKISRMETMAPLTVEGLPKDAVTNLLLSPEIEKIFDQNEVEGVEAELPHKPLERQPEPQEGFFCTIGVTIPAKTFDKTFGEFEMEMGGELCTVQFEDVKSELNRIEAMAAVMRQAKKCQVNGTIPEFIVTAQLDAFNFRLMVTKKLGPSIEKQVLSGNLSTEERLKLVSLTFNCMEDLLFSNIIHRDIKPSSFHYDFLGSKLLISNLGLARITPKSPRLKVPFFGNLTFCSPSTHLNLERAHFDDMISYFFVVMWIFNKDSLIWSTETDKTVVYQLKSDIMEGKVLEERMEKFIKDQKIKDFMNQLFRMILKLPPKRPSYRKIKELIEKNSS
uniref:Protein kinase domain-containing protein n=1 Tax=Bursaphelenchus xylophilus TaxID=6326 RepID=A0A1I7RUZ6_BURXY